MSDDLSPSSPEVLNAFYRRLYPFKSIFKWLNHEHTPTRQWTNREIAFTLQSDVYLRYQSFSNVDEFKKQVCNLNPTRFEVGPVYSARPKDRKVIRNTAFTPIQRELVFDIDMTDYDSIRTCCKGAGICKRCWGFISAAVVVIDAAMREQFGYQHLLWVYSGRRGIHLWISDREAMELTDEQRKAVVGWMTVVAGGKEMAKKVNVRIGAGKGNEGTLPPSVREALGILSERFTELILEDQDCFRERAAWEELLKLIPDKSIVRNLQDKWDADEDRSSEEKWDNLKKEIQKYKKHDRGPMMAALEDIVLQYTYPRIDAEVSKHRNHLLKAPFCVHPKTGRICVPVDPGQVDEFDPESVPTIGQLLRELDAAKTESGTEDHSDWEKTSLKPYVDMLEKHAAGLMGEVRKVKREMDTSW